MSFTNVLVYVLGVFTIGAASAFLWSLAHSEWASGYQFYASIARKSRNVGLAFLGASIFCACVLFYIEC